MVFWRTKTAKTTDVQSDPTESKPAGEANAEPKVPAEAVEPDHPAEPAADDGKTNIVALTPARLSERLTVTHGEPKEETPAALTTASRTTLSRTSSRPSSVLRKALSAPFADGHVLVIAPAEPDRLQSIVDAATECADAMAPPGAWIVVAMPVAGGSFPVIQVERHEAQRLSADANTALRAASRQLRMIAAGDDYRLALDVLAEERRNARELPIEQLKRRAEAQNIAVVKTLDGYVLAPMHDGRVVRQEVFRALPEGLQRDVETKLSILEGELKTVMASDPDAELGLDKKDAAVIESAASQASSAIFASLRAAYAGLRTAEPFFACVEATFIVIARDWLESGREHAFNPGCTYCLSRPPQSTSAGGVPVVTAFSLEQAALLGQIGLDATGRIAVRGGALCLANGGFLIAEGWRLAAEPRGWMTLSATLERARYAPTPSRDLIAEIEEMPLDFRLVLLADEASYSKLEAIDPGVIKHFPTVVRMSSRTEDA